MKLFIIHVGYYDYSVGIYELHSNIFVVAENVEQAKNNIKIREVFKEKNMHIDGIQEISCVDGYEIVLAQSTKIHDNKQFTYNEIKNLG